MTKNTITSFNMNSPPTPDMMMPPLQPSMVKMDEHMMQMSFFWGYRVDILFFGWPGNQGVGVYIFALFVVFLASFLVELLAHLPGFIKLNDGDGRFWKGLVLTGFAGVRTGLSYLVMLAVMSFNVGVLIVAVLGHALGFLIFGSGIFKRSSSSKPVVATNC